MFRSPPRSRLWPHGPRWRPAKPIATRPLVTKIRPGVRAGERCTRRLDRGIRVARCDDVVVHAAAGAATGAVLHNEAATGSDFDSAVVVGDVVPFDARVCANAVD